MKPWKRRSFKLRHTRPKIGYNHYRMESTPMSSRAPTLNRASNPSWCLTEARNGKLERLEYPNRWIKRLNSMLDAPLPQEAPPEGSPDVQKLEWWRKEKPEGCDCEVQWNFTEKGAVDYLQRDIEAPVTDIAAQRLEECRENPPLLQPARGKQSNGERRKGKLQGGFSTPAVPPDRVGSDRTRQRSNWRWRWVYI